MQGGDEAYGIFVDHVVRAVKITSRVEEVESSIQRETTCRARGRSASFEMALRF